ncbi:MAG: MFS transporter [Chloroflexi bacterium]|nr:MFS transporter [Chloroflexota bacterium]
MTSSAHPPAGGRTSPQGDPRPGRRPTAQHQQEQLGDPPITREQLVITIGVLAALTTAALDFSVVGTAMPTIIGQLGGLSEYAWVFTGYMLTSTTTVPLFSKLADIYGRKPIFLFGLAVFVIASMLCGISGSMFELIAFRTLQGLGAGALQPIAFTIVGDIYTPAQRARIQGLFSAVWGTSAVIGPALGGIITTTVGWPWVFFINLPVGILAAIIVLRAFHEKLERRSHQIDWPGMVTLTGGVAVLLFALSEGGDELGYGSPAFIALLAFSVVLLVGFVVIERRAPEPLIDFRLLKVPVIRAGLAVGTLSGVVMFGLTTFVPPLVQGVHLGTPLEAGAAVAAMSIGWPIGSVIGGRLMLRYGSRNLVISGTALHIAGTALLTQAVAIPDLWVPMLSTGIAGFGMGIASTPIMVSIQGSVAWAQRGVATGLQQFSRSIGGSVGVGLMGGILTAAVGTHSTVILDPFRRNSVPLEELAATRDAMGSGLLIIVWIVFVASLATFLIALRSMPRIHIRELDRGGERARQDLAAAPDAANPIEGAVEPV